MADETVRFLTQRLEDARRELTEARSTAQFLRRQQDLWAKSDEYARIRRVSRLMLASTTCVSTDEAMRIVSYNLRELIKTTPEPRGQWYQDELDNLMSEAQAFDRSFARLQAQLEHAEDMLEQAEDMLEQDMSEQDEDTLDPEDFLDFSP